MPGIHDLGQEHFAGWLVLGFVLAQVRRAQGQAEKQARKEVYILGEYGPRKGLLTGQRLYKGQENWEGALKTVPRRT